jgi:hydroxymethylglutaryl-CoA reductase
LLDLGPADQRVLNGHVGLTMELADQMVENAYGLFSLPVGVCANLRLDGVDRLIPMVIEEPSVVAAASHAAKLLRAGGGVRSQVTPSHMIGQIQLLDVALDRLESGAIGHELQRHKRELLDLANSGHHRLCAAGGGAIDLELRRLEPLRGDDPVGTMVIVHLVVDVCDAMGANVVNTMCERLAPVLEQLIGARSRLRILSNLTDRRRVRVEGVVPFSALEGKGPGGDPIQIARGIEEASVFAERDPYRAATHNKGIMNGVDAVLIAFGQDFRAVEAGAHAFAARDGRYTALSRWRVIGETLRGEMDLPLAVGTVGGVAKTHPMVGLSLRLSGINSAAQLASAVAAVGLAQNLGALRALATEGIQAGHMKLHARKAALEAGAVGSEIDRVSAIMASRCAAGIDAARAILQKLRLQAA